MADPGSLPQKEKHPPTPAALCGNSRLNREDAGQDGERRHGNCLVWPRGGNSRKAPAKTSLLSIRGSPCKAVTWSSGHERTGEIWG